MKTVFIVDDSITNLVMAKNALNGVYKTFTMPSADRMFKLLEKITPDLILLDINMPEMNGFEALSIIRSDVKLKNIPVIFLTATRDTGLESYGFEMGTIDFISKPFSPPSLITHIDQRIELDSLSNIDSQSYTDKTA